MCRACAHEGLKQSRWFIISFGGSSPVECMIESPDPKTLLTDKAHREMKSEALMKINAESILHKNVERLRSDRERKYEESINKISNFVSHIWGLLVQHIKIEKEKKFETKSDVFLLKKNCEISDAGCWIGSLLLTGFEI